MYKISYLDDNIEVFCEQYEEFSSSLMTEPFSKKNDCKEEEPVYRSDDEDFRPTVAKIKKVAVEDD